MLDLGKYANAILSSWGITLALLIALILVTWRRSVQVKKALHAAEKRVSENG
ncbi:heme exporter protein CcmD [Aliiroseovarius sp. F47248L]|uniref:heme exporter protein CcmD n=1 Tax=Aliiroseovarius sp. F47248L TaxID=2926420 RepID=UPI001FF10798|nr:heme exporter protein CcmD [Aliiroseovarius sp. F47248L]MCK0138186.1 heme exporter protein CcmD [Aliiroseovarius sp. F47248L]